ncbi:MAG: GFA family protein [Pseudomonadota bacterium]
MPDTAPTHFGGCLCGAVRFAVAGDPTSGNHCHCVMCRKDSGSGVSTFVTFPTATLKWTGDTPTEYESSPNRFRGFCPKCGSSLTWRHGDHADFLDFRLGSFDDPALFKAQKHLWMTSALPIFSGIDPDIAHFDQSSI